MSGHRHATDRVDGKILAKCPNKENEDDPHLKIEAEYEDCAANTMLEELIENFPECGECDAELDYIQSETPSEVLD